MKKVILIFCLALLPFLSNAQTTVCDTIVKDSIIMTFNPAFSDSFWTEIGKSYNIIVQSLVIRTFC